jgi:hypothetical protein
VNIGTLYRVADNGLRIGAALNQLRHAGNVRRTDLRILYDNDPSRFGDNGQLPGLRFTDPFAVPVLFRCRPRLPVQSARAKLVARVDAFHPSDNTESDEFGTEWSYDSCALRRRVSECVPRDSEMGLTLGAGLAGQMDPYAIASTTRGPSGAPRVVTRFSLGINF